jgi:hypothetical protein
MSNTLKRAQGFVECLFIIKIRFLVEQLAKLFVVVAKLPCSAARTRQI